MFSHYRIVLCVLILSIIHVALWWNPNAVAQVSKLTESKKSQLEEASEYLAVTIKLNDLGLVSDSRMATELGLAKRKQVSGEASTETADALSDLGMICREQADYESARIFLEEALAINKKERGLEDPTTATVRERLHPWLKQKVLSLKRLPVVSADLALR